MMLWLLSLALAASAVSSSPALLDAPSRSYVGHQVVWGSVPVPLRGDIDIRTDTWMIVDMTVASDGSVRWTQRDCKIVMSPMMGIETSFAEGAVSKLPATRARLAPMPGGKLQGSWLSTWTQSDHDEDGFPGVSIHVDMPLCGGAVYITMTNRTEATATWVGDELLGEVNLSMERRTLGASNWCLRMGPNRQDQTMAGVFLLQPLPQATRCEAVPSDAWPNALRDSES